MQFEQLKDIVLEALDDLKPKEVTQLDVKGKTSVTDLIIVAVGSSNRHVKALANSVSVACKKAGVPPLGLEGERDGDWVLVDMGDIVVHVMQEEVRDYYNLEKLWEMDASAVEQMRSE